MNKKSYNKGGMFHLDEVREAFKYASSQDKRDVCFAWIKEHGDWGMLNASEVKGQIKIWRGLAKEGKVAMNDYNNKTVDIDGVKFYVLVIQAYENGYLDKNDGMNQMCVGAMSHGTMVSGAQYYFKHETNRDAVYAYVMKDIEIKDKSKK